MTADVELLPELVAEGLDYFDKSGDEGDKQYVSAIRQHIAARDAEIEALKAEAIRTEAELHQQAELAEARAERLAEAGRRVTAAFRAHGETTPFTREAERTRHECEAAMLALDSALNPTAAQENDDA